MMMKKTLSAILMAALLSFMGSRAATAQTKATARFNPQNTHQRITGFGGFVCSPQFGYNHMSASEIKKVWGAGSTVGCNIMRLYIPIGRNAWSQSLATAKQAKQLGLIVFASPWGQPAEWKTNGTSNAKNEDGTTGKLKRENWADYAQYLEDYVQYLRNNGVELDAISIQNEPDWPAQYAGCLWDASEIAEFVKTYGKSISCKVMAPETLAVSDAYANALNKTDVLDFSTDPNCTSIDMTAVTALPATLPWLEGSNRVVYVSGNSNLSGTNVVKDGVCASLAIDERVGPFHPAQTFTATQASYTCEVNGQHIVQLPFTSVVPEGVNAYVLTDNLTPVAVTEVAANQPLLVEGHGTVTFLGSGEVSYVTNPLSDDVLPIETPTAIRTVRHISPNPFYYDLHGKRVDTPHKGVIIRNGKKYVSK